MPRPVRTLLVLLAIFSGLLYGALPASAGTKSVRASALDGGDLVFKLRGKVKPRVVNSAGVRYANFKRRVSTKRVRRAARHGVLRVRLSRKMQRKLRLSLRRQAGKPRANKLPVATAKAPRLVVITRPPAPSTGRWTMKNCAVPAGARYVSPNGADGNPGTVDRPWRTLEKAESAGAPGTTVVLRGGRYSALGKSVFLERDGSKDAPISWVGAPGEKVSILGHVTVEGNSRSFCGLVFDGPTGPVVDSTPDGERDKLYVGGNDFKLKNSEIRGGRWHSGIFLLDAERFSLEGNYVHDNGRFGEASHANVDQGVYVGSGSGRIEGNRIEHNFAHGIQLYPRANGVTVRRNVITGHGRAAVMLGENASNNSILDNDIHGNAAGIESWSLTGDGNSARSNRLWNNKGGNLVELSRVAQSDNDSR